MQIITFLRPIWNLVLIHKKSSTSGLIPVFFISCLRKFSQFLVLECAYIEHCESVIYLQLQLFEIAQ